MVVLMMIMRVMLRAMMVRVAVMVMRWTMVRAMVMAMRGTMVTGAGDEREANWSGSSCTMDLLCNEHHCH